jgi:hypothetical protein
MYAVELIIDEKGSELALLELIAVLNPCDLMVSGPVMSTSGRGK